MALKYGDNDGGISDMPKGSHSVHPLGDCFCLSFPLYYCNRKRHANSEFSKRNAFPGFQGNGDFPANRISS